MEEMELKGFTRKELEVMLIGSFKRNNEIMAWLYENHEKVLREYEDEKLDGLRFHCLCSQKSSSTAKEKSE